MREQTRSWRSFGIGVCVASLATASFGCGGSSPVAPSPGDQLSERRETAHYIFLYSAGDRVDPEWQETYYAWVSGVLGVNPARKIEYRKYRDRQHMGRLTGNSQTNGYAEVTTFTIHTLWPIDNHEVVHLYSSEFGSPVALFSEGFAVAHSTNPATGDLGARWNGTPVHDAARQLRASGRLIAIADLATTNGFRRFDPNATYPEAGSFVRFLIDAEGLDRMKSVFAQLTANDSLDRVRAVTQAVYGSTLEELEARWLDRVGR